MPEQEAAKAESSKKCSLGKIKIENPASSGGSCPFHNWFYIGLAILGITYAVYVNDREAFQTRAESIHLGSVHTVFQFIETYSPFHEFLETDEELVARLKKHEVAKEKVFTAEELAQYDGSEGSPGLHLAFLGVVYDVATGSQYYGADGGYNFFAARDASRAFVTGNFEEAGLVQEVDGLQPQDYIGLQEWQGFYEKDYVRVGLVEGAFYTAAGQPTAHWTALQGWIAAAQEEREEKDVEKQMFPPCNAEWTQAEGSRFWCTQRSGGVARSWVGVPRQLFYPGREPRCACARDSGPPSTDPSDRRTDRGDLDSPHLKPYPGCREDSAECRTKED
jgi:predicted heme/steroid binding protein